MTTYPTVIGEFETVRELLTGKSIARLGDGEFKIAYGKDAMRQVPHPKLSLEMRLLLCDPHPDCLVGIPTMDPRGAKFFNWQKHYVRFSQKLSTGVTYYSAFITRPDSAQWINVPEYALMFQQVWAGKRVSIVCEPDNSMRKVAALTASDLHHVPCETFNAFTQIDMLEKAALAFKPDVVLLCVGPTATVLAHRIAVKGVQAIDIGSAGGFLLRLLNGKAV